MFAALLWARTHVRTRWRSAALVVLIAALCAATSIAAIAGARRTSTSFSRFVRTSKDINIYVAVPDQPTADVALSVLRGTVGPRLAGEAVFLAAKPVGIDKNEEFSLGVIGDVTDTNGREASVPKVVAGRVPTGAREVALNDLAAKRFGVGAGGSLAMVGYSATAFEACSTDPTSCTTDVDLGVVSVAGILRFPGDISPEVSDSLSIALSPTLTKSWVPIVASQQWLAGAFVESSAVREQLGAAITDAIGPERISGESADVFLETDAQSDPERVDGALDVEHNGLLLLGLLAGVAGLVAVPQALARHRAAASTEETRLLALGWTTRNQRRARALWSAMLGAAAAALAVVGAIAMSPLFPIGLARMAEPSTGVHADWVVLSLGALSTLVVVVGAGGLVTAHRARRAIGGPGRIARLFSASRPVRATAGRFLLEEGRLSAVARTTLATAAFGVAMLACAATVIRSEDHMMSRPELYGAPWDLQGPVIAGEPDQGALDALNTDGQVAASALLTGGRITVDGEEIGAVAIDKLKGSIEPTILAGRPVLNDGEIVLGPAIMERHHVALGDSIDAGTSTGSGALTVVGSGVPLSVGSYSSSSGAVVSPADYSRYATPSTVENEGGLELAVRLAPAADVSVVRGEMGTTTGGFERVIKESFRPARISNIERVRSVPLIIEAFAGLLTLLVLVHSLATVSGRRRRELSVLRALGMKPSDARHVLWWHGAILGALTVAIGLPLGVVAGRMFWRAITTSIDSVYSPRAPWALLAVVAAASLMLSVTVGAALSRRAVPHSIARLLRSE
jgi:hypothetical protein